MDPKRTTKELIFASLMDLLHHRTIEQITVRDISNNCGISTRSFYNNFVDKHDVVSQSYLSRMRPYLLSSLREWNDQRSKLVMQERSFFINTICYQGQNNLLDTITWLDKEKYLLHIRPEVYDSPQFLQQVITGISYMIYGNVGLLKETYHGQTDALFGNNGPSLESSWELMYSWMPQVVRDNLAVGPVRMPSSELIGKLPSDLKESL